MKKQIFTILLMSSFGIGLYAQPKAIGEPRVVTTANELFREPVWSSDGTKLFFSSLQDATLWEVSEKGTEIRKASSEVTTIRSLKLAADTDPLFRQMLENPLDATSKVEALKSLCGSIILNPVLSPAGDKIAFEASRDNGFYIINTDGTELNHLTLFGEHPTWTPDGKYIVAQLESNDGHVITKGELISVNVNTGAVTTLLSSDKYIAFRPAVSPDGTKLAFENFADGSIYIIDIQY